MLPYLFVALAGIAQSAPTKDLTLFPQLDNGVGKTPAMGFNNWNSGLRTYESS